MKKIILIFSCLVAFVISNAQEQQETGVIIASGFHITPPLREMFANFDESTVPQKQGVSGDRSHREPPRYEFTAEDGAEYGNDPKTIQAEKGDIPSDGTRANWAGQTASGFRPYDPSGAAGPNHYIQMINSTTFKIHDKASGNVILTGTLGNLWNPPTGNNGDPIVMYDKDADRWFLAQFGTSTDRKIYIAVSTTNDPTGSYYTYTYVSPQFPDYLKFGIWHDGYYMTSNQSTQKVFCFERSAMLSGIPGARSIYVNYSPPKAGFFCPLPADAGDGTLPPAGTPCPILSYEDNGWGAGYADEVNIYTMTVNWSSTPTASISFATSVPCAAFDASYNSSWNDCPQPGTTQKLDGIGGVLMYRAQWKTWSGYNTIVLNWAVNISSTQRGIKWAELRQNQSTGAWSMYQEGIFTPGTDTRWMGSISMDNNGSIGLSYLRSNSTSMYPSLYYTGRRSCDPLGTLPVTETLVIAGTGSQTGMNRVGDYAHTCLDPDGVTFWTTGEYMGGATGSSAARTRIFSYTIPSCAVTASVSIAVTGGSNPACLGSSVTFTATPVNGGTTPSYQWKVNGANVGTNSATYTSSSLANGDVVTCVMTSNAPGVIGSPATSNAITMTINSAVTPTITIAQTSGSNPTCAGVSAGFTATITNGGATPSYQWKVNGVNSGTNSATFSSTSLTNGAVVSCTLTSSLTCATSSTANSNSITMTVNPSVTPAVSIAITAGTNPTNSGSSVTFTATPTNGGGTPTYQWKVNGANVGSNSPTYTTTTLTNGAVVSCVMTSSASCAVPSSATSNSITMTVNGGVITYCGASTTNVATGLEYIKKVVCGTINKSSGRTSYSNFTSSTTTVTKGTSRSFTITLGSAYSTDRVIIWCDWNNNGSFLDAGEQVYYSPLGVGPFSSSFLVPTTAVTGSIRMRIRLTDTANGANETPCGASAYGEVEDYTLNVVAPAGMAMEDDEETVAQERTPDNGVVLDPIVLTVYPNPNNGAFSIKGGFAGTYYMMSETGQLVDSFRLDAENNFSHEVQGLAAGVYIISGQNEHGVAHQKVIVTR